MGKTAIAKALVKLAKASGFRVTAVAPDVKPDTFDKVDELITQYSLKQVNTTPASSIVVATQGDNDEIALQEAIGKTSAYLGFVSSRKKGDKLMDYLKDAGLRLSNRLQELISMPRARKKWPSVSWLRSSR
jgi:xanthine dehydrogenase accessory factor